MCMESLLKDSLFAHGSDAVLSVIFEMMQQKSISTITTSNAFIADLMERNFNPILHTLHYVHGDHSKIYLSVINVAQK